MWRFQELSTDSSQHVRAALASVIMGMAPLLGKVREVNSWIFLLVRQPCILLTLRINFALDDTSLAMFGSVVYFLSNQQLIRCVLFVVTSKL